jgi:hypothetical protein
MTAGASVLPLVVALSGDFSTDERQAVEDMLRQWPARVLAAVPKTFVRDALACGDADGLPPDSDLFDREGRAHLCPRRPGAGPADVARQVALVSLFRFDREAGWSDDPAWRRLNGWQRSIAGGFQLRPANLDPRGSVSPLGRRSPRWDLVTFIAALLIDGAAASADDGVACRLISHTTFVSTRLGTTMPRCAAFERWAALDDLADIEVVLAAPSTAMVGSLFGHLFLRLAYRDETGETPLHTSRAVSFLADNDTPFSEDPAYALKGIAGLFTASLHDRAFLDSYREYVVLEGRDLRRWRLSLTPTERRRLLERIWTVKNSGRYTYYFFTQNCATLMVNLMNDVWSPASAIALPGVLAAPPASVLEPWERAAGVGGAPRLQFVPEPILSFLHQAQLTSRHRLVVEPRIVAGAPGAAAPALTAAFAEARAPDAQVRARGYERLAALLAADAVGSPDDVRAWLRDAAVIESHLSTVTNLQLEAEAERDRRKRVHQAAAGVARRLQDDAAALERTGDPAGVARAGRLVAAIRRLDASDGATRLDGYRALAGLAGELSVVPGGADTVARVRLLGLLGSEAHHDVARMKEVPGLRRALLIADSDRPIDQQPYLAGQGELVRPAVVTRVSAPLRSLQRAKQRLFAARDMGNSTAAASERELEKQATIRETSREYAASLPRSGIDRLAVLAAVTTTGDAASPAAAGLVLGGALYDERLGEHRRFGFPSDTALAVGRSATLLTAPGGTGVLAAYEMRLVGYRSMRLPLPESGGGRWPLGWELFADLAGSRARALTAEAKAGWGVLAPLFERGQLRDHLLGGAGIAYEIAFPDGAAGQSGRPQSLTLPLSLEIRVGLGAEPRYRSWLAARAWTEPKAVVAGAPARFAYAAGATVEAHLGLSSFTGRQNAASGPALVVGGQVARTSLTFNGASATTSAMLSLGIAWR